MSDEVFAWFSLTFAICMAGLIGALIGNMWALYAIARAIRDRPRGCPDHH